MAIIEPGTFYPDILEAAMGAGELAPAPVPYTGGLTILPPGRVVALAECKGRMFLATELMVCELVGGIWHAMVFATGD